MIADNQPDIGQSGQLQRLWVGVQQQDRQSLTDLYRQLYNDLLNAGLRVGHDGETVRDALNQIFLELWERGQSLPAVDNVRSYLITYLRRKLLRDYERGQRLGELTGTEPAGELSYEAVLIRQQQDEHRRQRLQTALSRLTPRQKELIELRFFENLTNEAISQATGMHINTVYNTMSSALKTLRQTLNRDELLDGLAIGPWLLMGLAAGWAAFV